MQESLAEYQQQAEDCLRSLIFGLHPKTQEKLIDPGVLSHPDVLRSLMLALKALESKRFPAELQSDPGSRRGKLWNKEEDHTLTQDFYQGRSVGQIARALGRSPDGICARLVRLRLVASRDEAKMLLGARSERRPD